MASKSYSFLDIVVLDEVRERFAAGDALAVLSASLDEILWANGAGAAWLGFPDIEAAIGERSRLPATALRQISATPGFPNIGRDRAIALRVTSGLKSRIVSVQASAIALPGGEEALLLALPLTSSDEGPAHSAVAGFSEPGHFAAFVEADGTVSAACTGFDQLGIEPETLLRLVQDVGEEKTRLVKTRIPARTHLPAGIARLTDDPARHLLLIVEDGVSENIAPAASIRVAAPEKEALEAGSAAHEGSAGRQKPLASHDHTSRPHEPDERTASRTVRFSWRTDAQGRFSSISDEFAQAMGRNATDVIGRAFREVSNAFGLDADGSISRLLDRRDTWSGRTVMWPLEGTNLKVPVDLAALPIYGRGRVFEGFRGFGIARLGEAELDPEAIGTVLAPSSRGNTHATTPVSEEQEPHRPSAYSVDQDKSATSDPVKADPFQGEKPASGRAAEPQSEPKIVRLAEHRESTWDGSLSASERTTFREIGERLRRASEGRLDAEDKEGKKSADRPLNGRAVESTQDELPNSTILAEEEPLAQGNGELDDGAEEEVFENPANENVSQPTAMVEADGSRHDIEELQSPADQADQVDQDDLKNASLEDKENPDLQLEAAPGGQGEEVRPELEADAPRQSTAAGGEASDPVPDTEAHFEQEEEQTYREPEETEDSLQQAASGSKEQGPAAEPAETASQRRSQITYLPSAFHRPEVERKQTEAETILAHLPLPVLIHSGDRLHYANREFYRLTGYADLAELESAGGLGALFEEPAAGNSPKKTLLLRMADGTDRPVEAHLQSVAWDGRKALMLALHPAMQAEPTPEEAAKAAELEARLSEMRAIVDTATDGIAVIGNDGTIRSINRPAEALFGFDAENVTGKPFTSLFAIESQRTVQDYLAGLSDNGVASVLNDGRQVIGRESQGRFIPLFMTIGRLPNGSGYCAVLRDITHWKRAEEDLTQARAQAERASSQKSEFLARVSHEIRTPLNAIIGFSELMIDEKFGPIGNDRYRDYLRDINRSGNHVLDLVNDLLDISKIEAGQQEMAHEAVPLNDTLAQVIAMMQPQANRERVIIRSSLASRLPDVVADLRSVRQIAINLLSNAVRYTPAGGQVVVSTVYERDGSVVLRVRDTGVGMSSAELDEALKPFRQINALRRKRGDGTGLGLPLTRAMVEANRAQFSIASTPGEGTLVEITFPPTRVLAE